jgi:hypothetical protein
MQLFNKTSLFYLHPTLSALKALKKEKASKSAVLLVFLLLIFAAAAFTLAVTASGLNPDSTVEAGFQTGSLQFSAPEYLVGENGGNATITVTRTGSSSGALTITASTSNGTAIAGQDYAATTVTLTFPNGVTSRTFNLPMINDNLDEPNETVNLTLSNQVGGTPGSPLTAVLTITDDDTSAISINDVKVAEGNAGTSNAIFTISLSNPSVAQISVNYATANDTATAGSDYAAKSGAVTFNPNQTSQTVQITINGDVDHESDETFFVNLSNASNHSIADGQGVGTIVNDDLRLDVPGIVPSDTSMISDQKAGSILLFPIYSSMASFPNLENTQVNITNIDSNHATFIHLFVVDGATCSVTDAFVCLTPNQTASFLMSDLDPGTSGYIVAVAVDVNGCPTIFNGLIGDAYVKLGTAHSANLGAIAVAGLSGLVNHGDCAMGSSTAQLNFDGISYNPLPRVLAADNLPSRQNGNEVMLILDRIGGNLATGAAKLESVFGLLYDDAENAFSFGFNPNACQFRAVFSNAFPRTTPRIGQVIPAGRSGWMKLWSFDDAAIIGAMINFNPGAGADSAAFNQGHNLHILTLTYTVSVTIPVFPPAC